MPVQVSVHVFVRMTMHRFFIESGPGLFKRRAHFVVTSGTTETWHSALGKPFLNAVANRNAFKVD